MRSLNELWQVCERATKGPWQNNAIRVEPIGAPRYELNDGWIIADFVGPEAETNAVFTATFNPAFVLSLLDQLAASQLTWTTETPTKAGWYWYKEDGLAWCVHVMDFDTQPVFARFTNGRKEPIQQLRGEWAGPIPTPGWRDE